MSASGTAHTPAHKLIPTIGEIARLKAEVERLRAALTQVKNDLSEAAAPLFNKVPKVWDDLRQVHMKAEHALYLVPESTKEG